MDVAATKLDDVAKEHAELLAALPEIREGAWEAGAATMSVWSYVYLRGIHVMFVRHSVGVERSRDWCCVSRVSCLSVGVQATRLQALKDAAAQAETRAVTLHDENEAWKFAKRDLEVCVPLCSCVLLWRCVCLLLTHRRPERSTCCCVCVACRLACRNLKSSTTPMRGEWKRLSLWNRVRSSSWKP